MNITFQKGQTKFLAPVLAILVLLLVIALGTGTATARERGGEHGSRGGDRVGHLDVWDHDHDPASDIYTGPGLKTTGANQVRSMAPGVGMLLKGHIVKQLGTDKFLFQDSTGTATVMISQSDWNSLQPGPSDLVEIHGKITRIESGIAVEAENIATVPR